MEKIHGAGIIVFRRFKNGIKILGLKGPKDLRISRKGTWDYPKGTRDEGEDVWKCAQRETMEEAKLQVSDVKLFTILSVPHINQIYTFFTGKVVNDDFGPTPESSEVELFKFDDIPWSELAFPTVIKTLKLFLEHGDDKVINETLKPRV